MSEVCPFFGQVCSPFNYSLSLRSTHQTNTQLNSLPNVTVKEVQLLDCTESAIDAAHLHIEPNPRDHHRFAIAADISLPCLSLHNRVWDMPREIL